MASGLQDKPKNHNEIWRERMKTAHKRFSYAAIFLLAILSASVFAQESGTIQATATVLPSMSVTGRHDLEFGTVLPATDKSVDKVTVGSAGELRIQGSALAEVVLDFTLPTALALITDSTALMTIIFSSTDASYDDETGGGQSSPTGIIDPRGPNTLDLGATGRVDIWLGGTVQPGLTQTGGDYSADITLTVSYTGN
jgi:hypothetical protein